MTAAPENTVTAGGVQLVDTTRRPARTERREHPAESVLSLEPGAGPSSSKEDDMGHSRPPARPVRFDDPARNAAYWARIDRIVSAAPPLSDEQIATLRGIFSQARTREAA
ncbi:hypothetical protein [Streptomyces sp. NPDC047028]|uniref:hypothetical protein n=1 Tax=Streptomyces sp. NPDC047028 TaxID=3155793 RepID=UPI0033E67173